MLNLSNRRLGWAAASRNHRKVYSNVAFYGVITCLTAFCGLWVTGSLPDGLPWPQSDHHVTLPAATGKKKHCTCSSKNYTWLSYCLGFLNSNTSTLFTRRHFLIHDPGHHCRGTDATVCYVQHPAASSTNNLQPAESPSYHRHEHGGYNVCVMYSDYTWREK